MGAPAEAETELGGASRGHGPPHANFFLKELLHSMQIGPQIYEKLYMMGGYFMGRPMDPESRPAKTRETQAGLHFKLHGVDKGQAGQPVTSP